MIRYKHLFYLLDDIRVRQDIDSRFYISRLTTNQFATDDIINNYNYQFNKDLILQLK